MAEAGRWGLQVLCEAHDEPELERALAASARIVGINQRDLRTFEVDTTLALRLRARVPHGRIVVAESGIRTADDVERLRAGGVDAILVGEALMRAPDPGLALQQLLAAPMKFTVKICGVTRPEDAAFAAEQGATAIGLNFWRGSKRFVEDAQAREILAALPTRCCASGSS